MGEYRYPDSYILGICRAATRLGKKCFTYKGMFYALKKLEGFTVSETTIERYVRKLVEDGYLARVRERPSALFCIKEDVCEYFIKKVSQLLAQSRTRSSDTFRYNH